MIENYFEIFYNDYTFTANVNESSGKIEKKTVFVVSKNILNHE